MLTTVIINLIIIYIKYSRKTFNSNVVFEDSYRFRNPEVFSKKLKNPKCWPDPTRPDPTQPAKIRQNRDPTRPAVPSDPWTTLNNHVYYFRSLPLWWVITHNVIVRCFWMIYQVVVVSAASMLVFGAVQTCCILIAQDFVLLHFRGAVAIAISPPRRETTGSIPTSTILFMTYVRIWRHLRKDIACLPCRLISSYDRCYMA